MSFFINERVQKISIFFIKKKKNISQFYPRMYILCNIGLFKYILTTVMIIHTVGPLWEGFEGVGQFC